MAGMQGLGHKFNVTPIAAGVGISLRDCSGITFVCTGNDTFTVTVASTFAGSYATPGNILTTKYTNTATDGTAVWVKTAQSASNAVTIASGTVAIAVYGAMLPDPKVYIKCSVGSSGLVMAITHDLTYQRGPANLPKMSA